MALGNPQAYPTAWLPRSSFESVPLKETKPTVSDSLDPRVFLFSTLALLTAWFLFAWYRAASAATRAGRDGDGWSKPPSFFESALGFVTNFFDTLGIGSFAPTTSAFKMKRVVPDENIPGTMMIGHTAPVVIQAFIFIAIISVDPVTLVTLLAAAVLGAWLGAGVVARLPRYRIQVGMGVALLLAAVTFVLAIFEITAVGGEATGLSGAGLVIAFACLFALGALMTIGIGMYAPTMIVVSLMGMDPTVAFPIMMGASAFLMPVASVRFLKAGRYGLKAALGLAVGGIPAVLVAAFIVRSLPLNAMRWLVVAVVLYAAILMLRSAMQERRNNAG